MSGTHCIPDSRGAIASRVRRSVLSRVLALVLAAPPAHGRTLPALAAGVAPDTLLDAHLWTAVFGHPHGAAPMRRSPAARYHLAGQCADGTQPGCDDGLPCTADRCDAGGCSHELIPDCWVTEAALVASGFATASAAGRTVTCTLRCRDTSTSAITLRADGTYRTPGSVTDRCPSGQVIEFPEEVGTVSRRPGGRLFLRPDNLDEIRRGLRACAGRRVVLRGYRSWLRLAADGASLRGVSIVRLLQRGSPTTAVRVEARFNGVPAMADRPTPPAGFGRRLPVCTLGGQPNPALRPRCVVR
jgi:hypothetical protein